MKDGEWRELETPEDAADAIILDHLTRRDLLELIGALQGDLRDLRDAAEAVREDLAALEDPGCPLCHAIDGCSEDCSRAHLSAILRRARHEKKEGSE